MRVWVYCGQHDLQVDVRIFAETAEKKAREHARRAKAFFKKRLVYTLNLVPVHEQSC